MADLHREYCRRQQRTLGHWLATEAWVRGVDCVVIEAIDVLSFLGLDRFKSPRPAWLEEDLKPWFPHQVFRPSPGWTSSTPDLYLSRFPIADLLRGSPLKPDDWIKQLPADAPRAENFSSSGQLPSEAEMVSELAKLSAGLSHPIGKRRRGQKRR